MIEINFYHNSEEVLRGFSDDKYQEVRERYPELNLPEKRDDKTYLFMSSIYGDAEDLWYLAELGLSPIVKRIRGVHLEALPPVERPKELAEQAKFQIVNVSVPNASLFSVTQVTWIEDACTNELQGYLDRGWRILAVCPPNDTRRPTYILGRMDKED